MGLATSGLADPLKRSANLPSMTAFTLLGLFLQTTDTNAYSDLLWFDGTASGGVFFSSDGSTLAIWNGSTEQAFGASPTLGTPFWAAFTGDASNVVGYWRGINDRTWNTNTLTNGLNTPGFICIGGNDGSEPFTGRFSNIKVWDRALTATELMIESFYERVCFPTSINFYWPCYSIADVADRSGNGRNPTLNASVTTADAPWQPWRPRQRRPLVPVAAGAASLEHEGFRFRNDDGSESAATWAAAQDTNISTAAGTQRRLRDIINATNDPTSQQFGLQFRKQGGDGIWRPVRSLN